MYSTFSWLNKLIFMLFLFFFSAPGKCFLINNLKFLIPKLEEKHNNMSVKY